MTLASMTKAFAELQETIQGLWDTIKVNATISATAIQRLQETINNNGAGGNNEDGSDEEIHKLYKDKSLCINDFKLLSFEILGKGSSGKVYLCRGPGGTEVALKVLSVSEKNNLDKIKKEIQIHSCISPHINIIQIYGSFPERQNICLVLEYALSHLDYPLSASTLAKYMYQLIIGLIHIHEHRVMHRDLKFDNIMIGSDGNLKIVDFGCASPK